MNKNKKNLLTKEYKTESYILLVISIIGFIIGLLLIIGILKVNDGFKMDPKIFGIIIVACSIVSLIISVKDISKKNKFKKSPKSILYNQLIECYKNDDKQIIDIFKNNDLPLAIEDEKYPISFFDFENSFVLFIIKEKTEIYVNINLDKISLELCLNDQLDEEVLDSFYDYEDNLFSKEIKQDLSTDLESLINHIKVFYEEKIDILLERYEQYKQK